MPQTHFIRKIVDATGTTVYQADTQSKQVMASSVAKEMTSMMMDTYNNGTGASAKPYGYTVAGKTGSTETPKEWNVNGDKDQWAVGYTPDVVVATWTGFAYTTKTHYLQTGDGGNVDSIFKSEMTNLLPETTQTQFNVTSASAKVAATTASSAGTSSGSSSGSVWSDIQDGIQDGVNTVKDKAQEWYNDVQGLFN
nr:penicillin-binding transpeptidase domain-containing protein [Lacticaseibacillus pantheris]